MYILKKDFVDENTESYCAKGKKLSSGKAYFLQDKNGKIYFGGKQCAEMHGTNDLSQVPDLTKSLIARREGHSKGGSDTGSGGDQNDLSKPQAVAYMLLREEKLSDYEFKGKSLSYDVLKKYYNEYNKNHDLPESAVSHILNIEKKVSKNNKRLSLKNLSTCYAYQYILERTIASLDAKDNADGVSYVSDLLNGESGIKMYCSLTKEQISGLSKWLQFLPKDLRESRLRDFDL
ncbi:hypothetical protein NH398_09185 [Halomonas sp. CnH100-B]|uniref:hypothetical protein n=1 Tax=Halomonas sp. CnH100-B TaxID=2954490 RepID=UPI002096ACA1|nr:hypothetical protein [Halomonas sp. CnH100-B]MCO7229392.1 hypothetical protein [Halomonas sp. CnH100-B]